MIDSMTVIRCKRLLPDHCSTEDFGTRCDYFVSRIPDYVPRGVPWWRYPDQGWPYWNDYFAQFSKARKFSHGLAAVFIAIDRLNATRLSLAGCDRLMGRYTTPKAWETKIQEHPEHDWRGEHRCLLSLPVEIIECRSSSSSIPSRESRPTPPGMNNLSR